MPFLQRKNRLVATAAAALTLLAAAAGCTRADRGDASATDQGPAAEVRLGYFPNVTHASALIGLDKGLFAKELGSTKLTPTKFNAGPDEVSALLGDSLDIAFIGSGPAINAYSKSDGEAVRLIAGAASGGAQLVVRPDINTPQDLAGKTVADPQQGNTQDVALKTWLAHSKLGSVKVQNSENATTLDEFKKGNLAGAWLPEPWASRLVNEAGAKVLVNEKSLWPEGKFPTTVVVVRTRFLKEHPQTVQAVLRGLSATNSLASSNPAEAKAAVNHQLKTLTGKELSQQVIDRSFSEIELTSDPLTSRFPQLAADQVTAGVAKRPAKLSGFADVSALNSILQRNGQPPVDAAGLDK